MSVWTCLSSFSPTLPSNSWALGALFLFHTGRDSFPRPFTQPTLLCISINWKNKMFDMLPIFSAGRLLYLKFFSTLYSRILYSIGGTGHCTPNGCTSMSTVSTMSKQYCFTTLHLKVLFLYQSSLWHSKSVQICHTLWVNFWIRPPCWDFVPGIRHSCWSCSYWPSFVDPVALGGVEGIGDSWSSQRLPLPMEPLKFPATVWRVSKLTRY